MIEILSRFYPCTSLVSIGHWSNLLNLNFRENSSSVHGVGESLSVTGVDEAVLKMVVHTADDMKG